MDEVIRVLGTLWDFPKSQLEDVLIFYHRIGGLIVSQVDGETSIFLCRRITDYSQGLQDYHHEPDGEILWVDAFIRGSAETALLVMLEVIHRLGSKCKNFAYHRKGDAEDSYSVFKPRFALKYSKQLLRQLDEQPPKRPNS